MKQHKGTPHVGNLKRNAKIFELYDSGNASLKEIATQITCMGWHCTVEIVRYAIRQRLFYEKHFQRFPTVSNIESR